MSSSWPEISLHESRTAPNPKHFELFVHVANRLTFIPMFYFAVSSPQNIFLVSAVWKV